MSDQNNFLPWAQPGWFERASSWIYAELERQGRSATGSINLLHTRPWSALARVTTTTGAVYFKAVAPSLRFEVPLAKALAVWRPDCMLALLAADIEQGWMLSADAGVTLRSRIQTSDDLTHWHILLPLCAEIQIELAPRVPEALTLGMPDRRLSVLPQLYIDLLEDTEHLLLGRPQGLTVLEYDRLCDLQAHVAGLCQLLASYKLPETLTHEEIHDANVLVDDGRYIFIDWSDSSVSHPFFAMLVMLRSVADRLKLEEDSPELIRLRDCYLEPWTGFASRTDLLEAFRVAYRLGMINRALSWHSTLSPLSASDKERNGYAVPAWLQDFLAAV